MYKSNKEVEKNCAWCGHSFIAKKPNMKYCSEECRHASRKKKNREHIRQLYYDNVIKLEILDEIIALELERISPDIAPGSAKEESLNEKIFEQVNYYRILFLED